MGLSGRVRIGMDGQGELPLPWLEQVLQDGRSLSTHSILIHGPAGVGQFEAALLLAQAWLCESAAKPCGRCAACSLVRQRSHPDLLILVPDALRVELGWTLDDDPLLKVGAKPSRDIRVEQLRLAIAWTQKTSGRGHGKALVLHPAEAMNAVSANALLKTLEEPPPGTRLLLACEDPEHLLPTVRSRCQRLRLPLPPREQALSWLASEGVAGAAQLLDLAGGSPLSAALMADGGIAADAVAQSPTQLAAGDATGWTGRPLPLVLDLLQRLCHDACSMAVGGAPRFFALGTLRASADLNRLMAWRETLWRTARHVDHPLQAALAIESLFSQGARAWSAARTTGPPRRVQPLHSAR